MANKQPPSTIQALRLREEQDRRRLKEAMTKLAELGDMLDKLPYRERQHVVRVLHLVIERASRKLPVDTKPRIEASIEAHALLAMIAYNCD